MISNSPFSLQSGFCLHHSIELLVINGLHIVNAMVNPQSCSFSSQVRCDQTKHLRVTLSTSFSQSLIQRTVSFTSCAESTTPHLFRSCHGGTPLPPLPGWLHSIWAGPPILLSCSPLASVCSQCSSKNEPVETQVRPCHPSDPKPISLSVKVTVFAMADRPNITRSDLLVSPLWLILL